MLAHVVGKNYPKQSLSRKDQASFTPLGYREFGDEPESAAHARSARYPKSSVASARPRVSTMRSHSARVITKGGHRVMVLP